MAKRTRRGVNKSQKIRDVLTEKGIESPKEVMELLKTQGIKVSAAQVSNVKAAMRGKQAPSGAGKRAAAAGGEQALLSAFRFVKSVGGLSAARKALDEVSSLR